jgi:hypothetical protein
LSPAAREQAKRRFYRIVDHFDNWNRDGDGGTYNHARLIRLTHDHARPSGSLDTFLQAFFRALGLPIDRTEIGNEGRDLEERVRPRVIAFANHLFDNFFLPSRLLPLSSPVRR